MEKGKTSADGAYAGRLKPHGVIDAHAHHNCGATCPLPLIYVQVNNSMMGVLRFKNVSRAFTEGLISVAFAKGVRIQNIPTAEMGGLLVELNTRFYSGVGDNPQIYNNYKKQSEINKEKRILLNGREARDLKDEDELRKWNELINRERKVKKEFFRADERCVPSLIIVPTMDMEFAHLNGYEGRPIYQQSGGTLFYNERNSADPSSASPPQYLRHEKKSEKEAELEAQAQGVNVKILDDDDKLLFQKWKRQVWDTEAAAASNPLRHFPLFFYDPRRYRYGPGEGIVHGSDCELWNRPFARIAGAPFKDPETDPARKIKESSRIWIGFKMYPALGYRPLDERCGYLPRFYAKCQEYNIPILTHCAPGGMGTHEAEFYKEYDEKYCSMRDKRRSDMFSGKEKIYKNNRIDYFYRNYGHPQNWRPVLENFSGLRLCLAHFGGDLEWKRESMAEWARDSGRSLPPSEWIRTIVELTKKYPNVYTDISCLNINNDDIRRPFTRMLRLICDKSENNPCRHLRKKLIFGSDWYLTYLTDIAKNAEYGGYCNGFKELFCGVDDSGEFWEEVSLINPWNCYSLSAEKFQKMYDALPALAKASKVECEESAVKDTMEKLRELDKYLSRKKGERL